MRVPAIVCSLGVDGMYRVYVQTLLTLNRSRISHKDVSKLNKVSENCSSLLHFQLIL